MMQRAAVMKLLSRTGLAVSMSVLALGSAQAQPVRGLYIAGAGGASFNQEQRVYPFSAFPKGRDRYDTGVTGLGSIGWGLGNGFRVEVEGNYRNNRLSDFRGAGFPALTGGRQQGYGAMANALFDMDIGQNWVYPYFGAGIGYGWQGMNSSIRSADGSYRQHIGGTTGNFAYQAMFGLSFPVPWVVGLSTTMEYRFYSVLGSHKHSSTASGVIANQAYDIADGRRSTRTDFNHSLMLGLRYEFDPAPPPPPPAPVSAVPPAPSPVRTYLVFFDWDSATLGRYARAVIKVAAQNSTAVQFTRIQVSGHTDNSAAPGSRGKAHNQELSLKRANAVKAELIRDGVASGLIVTKGLGSSQPMVPTGPLAREAQNRRVEIELN